MAKNLLEYRKIKHFILKFSDGIVKYWTPEGVNKKQEFTSYEMSDDNDYSYIKIKQNGLYMIYSQVI